MFLTDLIVAVAIALLLTAIFSFGFRRIGPWRSVWIFFLILFLAAWAGGIWLTPVGFSLWGVNWLGFFLVGLIFALLLAAISPASSSTVELKTRQEAETEATMATALSVFFWILLFVFLVAIIARYIYL
jgi:hypothetical protein